MFRGITLKETQLAGQRARALPAPPVAGGTSLARRLLPVAALLLLLAIGWEGSKALFDISDNKLPHLTAIVQALMTRTQGGSGPLLLLKMLENARATFGVAVGGFVLGGALGFVLALLFTHVRILERSLMPYVIGSQTVPILAVAPIVVVGLGAMGAPPWVAKAVVAAYLTFFPVTIGMLRGLRSVSPDALALMRSYAASPLHIFFRLRLPASLPYLFTALKISATASVIGALVAELPASSPRGIGLVIVNATQYYNSNPPVLYAAVLVAGAIGLCAYGIVALTEYLVVRRPAARA